MYPSLSEYVSELELVLIFPLLSEPLDNLSPEHSGPFPLLRYQLTDCTAVDRQSGKRL